MVQRTNRTIPVNEKVFRSIMNFWGWAIGMIMVASTITQ